MQHWQEVKQHWQEVNATLAGSECNTANSAPSCMLEEDMRCKALTDVCDIIAMVKGNPRMKSFGEHMKMECEKGVCCHSVCACACACV